MSFQLVCATDDVWEGEFQHFEIDGHEIIVVHAEGGEFRVYDARCPHQDQSLSEASLENGVLTCPHHLWQFDVVSGDGVNPADTKLRAHPCRIEGENLLADLQTVAVVSR